MGILQMVCGDIVAQQIQDDSTKESSEASILIEVSQVIERHKIRLQNLKNDSARIEPMFQKNSKRFYDLNEKVDSLRAAQFKGPELVVTNYEWNHLRDIIDFLLDRRRSIHLQISILTDKLKKEKDLMHLLMAAETLSALRITDETQNKNQEAPKRNSIFVTDDGREDLERIDADRYNWRIV